MKKVLFVCIHNSARSQMAEALCNELSHGQLQAESAGLEPGRLNPMAVEAMKEIGLDISAHKSKSVADLIKQGKRFDYVITVCDEASAERCPVFPGGGSKLHFGFEDPSSLKGGAQEQLARTRQIRDQIKKKIGSWIREMGIKAD